MSESKDKPVYFYESPDGGETIYRRESGSEERVLVKGGNNTIYDMIQENLEDTSEIQMLKQKVLNLEMANAELKDMLRNAGVVI